jgi:hypothetical protein
MENKTYETFLSYANQQKQSVARTILQLAIQKKDEIPLMNPETREKLNDIIRLLRASGNNINQIAHACNVRVLMDEDPPSKEEGVQFLKNIREGMVQMEVMIERKLS